MVLEIIMPHHKFSTSLGLNYSANVPLFKFSHVIHEEFTLKNCSLGFPFENIGGGPSNVSVICREEEFDQTGYCY